MKRSLADMFAAAASGCISTSTNTASIVRPSKAGTVLLALVLDHITPLLELPPISRKTQDSPELKQMKTNMACGLGFLYEQAVYPVLQAKFSGWSIIEQPKLSWGSFHGTADYVLVSPDQTKVVVVDCKSLGVATLRELNSSKLTDNWGYRTQLSIYAEAVKLLYPLATVTASWYIWAVLARKQFVVHLAPDEVPLLAEAAENRVQDFKQVLSLFEQQRFAEAAELANSEPLLPKESYYGNFAAACGFHYSPLAHLFFHEESEGLPIDHDESVRVTQKLLQLAFDNRKDLG
jgi:hypothetical protein